MNDCHLPSVKVLEELLDSLSHLNYGRALAIAEGDGLLTKDLLRFRFKAIDCFDQCPEAVKKLEQLQERYAQIHRVDQATMQSYILEESYTCIFLRWCIGYLSGKELKTLLVKLSHKLWIDPKLKTRASGPSSYIVVLDNVCPHGQTWGPFWG